MLIGSIVISRWIQGDKKKRKKREKDWWLVYVNYTAAGLCTDTALGRTPVVSDWLQWPSKSLHSGQEALLFSPCFLGICCHRQPVAQQSFTCSLGLSYSLIQTSPKSVTKRMLPEQLPCPTAANPHSEQSSTVKNMQKINNFICRSLEVALELWQPISPRRQAPEIHRPGLIPCLYPRKLWKGWRGAVTRVLCWAVPHQQAAGQSLLPMVFLLASPRSGNKPFLQYHLILSISCH